MKKSTADKAGVQVAFVPYPVRYHEKREDERNEQEKRRFYPARRIRI